MVSINSSCRSEPAHQDRVVVTVVNLFALDVLVSIHNATSSVLDTKSRTGNNYMSTPSTPRSTNHR